MDLGQVYSSLMDKDGFDAGDRRLWSGIPWGARAHSHSEPKAIMRTAELDAKRRALSRGMVSSPAEETKFDATVVVKVNPAVHES